MLVNRRVVALLLHIGQVSVSNSQSLDWEFSTLQTLMLS